MIKEDLPKDLDSWLDYVQQQHWQSVDLGLSRMEEMVARLGLQRPARHVITVAGTNGKGTTCHALEGLLLAAGHSVGTTLSPHIDRFNERIRIAGEELTDDAICNAFAEVEAVRRGMNLTYFEYSTLAALWSFKEADLDYAILEIGLGGRLDAFNVIDADTAIITSIGYDHQEFLGETLAEIGREKAGIFRSGQSVVLGPNLPESVYVEAHALNLDPINAERDYRVVTDGPKDWSISGHGFEVDKISLGACAPSNIALAYVATITCGAIDDVSGPDILKRVAPLLKIRGRLQKEDWQQRTIYSDVAHNPAGLEFLCNELDLREIRPNLIVCGMLTGKDHKGVFDMVKSKIEAPWLLIDTYGERAQQAEHLRQSMGCTDAQCVTSQTLSAALLASSEPGDIVLGFGSFSAVETLGALVQETRG